MDFNNLERKTKAELFELIQSKQAEIDALKAKIDAVIDYIKNQERSDEYMTGIVDTDGLKELLK
ncbi:MAG: hypothetical protein J6S68_14390 [Acinetobacter sp.]|nr:hypothetical protein [Acinetobacter sp.]